MTIEPLEQIEQKGIGEKLPASVHMSEYFKYANLVKDTEGRFNVMLMNHPMLESQGPKVYLFPTMVSGEEAREKYDKLQ